VVQNKNLNPKTNQCSHYENPNDFHSSNLDQRVQILEEPGSNPYPENHHINFKMSDQIGGSLKKGGRTGQHCYIPVTYKTKPL
jgi:hypothetical protein